MLRRHPGRQRLVRLRCVVGAATHDGSLPAGPVYLGIENAGRGGGDRGAEARGDRLCPERPSLPYWTLGAACPPRDRGTARARESRGHAGRREAAAGDDREGELATDDPRPPVSTRRGALAHLTGVDPVAGP